MDQILTDINELSVSPTVIVNDDNQVGNLSLSEANIEQKGFISGVVSDQDTNPLENATIIVSEDDQTPVLHTASQADGSFSVVLDAGEYFLTVTKESYIATYQANVSVENGEETEIDLVLLSDENAENNIIYGTVTDNSDSTAIENATIYIRNTDNAIVGVTNTIENGEYVLENIPSGEYTILFIITGYQPLVSETITLTTEEMTQYNAVLIPDSATVLGTISGKITDQMDQPIANGFVGLCQFIDDQETLIAKTYTNQYGYYAFGNVVAGNYVVKAKETTIIEE